MQLEGTFTPSAAAAPSGVCVYKNTEEEDVHILWIIGQLVGGVSVFPIG